MSFRRGVWVFIYSPEEEPSALGSNRLHERWRCILGGNGESLWKGIEESLCGGWAALGWGRPAPPGSCRSSTSVLCLLVHISSRLSFVSFWQFNPLFILSRISLLKIIIHQNSWKLSVITPMFLLVTISMRKVDGLWWMITTVNKLPQAKSLLVP
jgi:hypothetical protein